MIARIWHGVVPREKADTYYTYLKKTGLNDYKKAAGNNGVKVLRKDEGRLSHYLLITYWDTFEPIKKFAGNDVEKARYYPEDEAYLLELEPFVNHYEILEDS